MAYDILDNLDIHLNQLLNSKLQFLASDPVSPGEARFWYNSTTKRFKWRDDATIYDITDALTLDGEIPSFYLDRANHDGTQLAVTISDFNTAVRTNRLDQMSAPTASVPFNSQKATGMANGTNPQDGATLAQVDAARQGVRGKPPVEAAATGNVTVANPGTDVFDGETVATGESVLLPAQTTGTEEGIYVFNGSGSAMTRRDDADTFGELDSGTETFVQGGATYGGKILRQYNELTSFAGQDWQIAGAGSTYAAGDGLEESPAGTFNVGTASASRIVVNGNNIDLPTGIATPGTYDSITIDTYGRSTGGTNPARIGKFTDTIGNGTDLVFTVLQSAHGLADDSSNQVSVYEVTTGDQKHPGVNVDPDTGDVTITFSPVIPTTDQYLVVIMG